MSMGEFNSLDFLKFGLVFSVYFQCFPFRRNHRVGWTTDTHITNSTYTGICGSSINARPDNSPMSPVRSCVVRSHSHDDLLHRRRFKRLWRLYNPRTDGQNRLIVFTNTWFRRRIQHSNFLVSNHNLLAAQ